ncbi:MAG: hypothetical protein H7X91_08535 [Burkholderiales bacterium]|nr:hypothetical protein [Burkholderiales bacterium]
MQLLQLLCHSEFLIFIKRLCRNFSVAATQAEQAAKQVVTRREQWQRPASAEPGYSRLKLPAKIPALAGDSNFFSPERGQ